MMSDEETVIATEDRLVIACNFVEATPVAPLGAAAFVSGLNQGNGNDRIQILVRSRSGRMIDKWESIGHLGLFRKKAMPAQHPLYSDDRPYPYDERTVQALIERSALDRQTRGVAEITAEELQKKRRQPERNPE